MIAKMSECSAMQTSATAARSRSSQCRLLAGWGLLLLLLAAQIGTSNCSGSASIIIAASGSNCNTHAECGIGYKCRNSVCQRKNCTRYNCDSSAGSPVCGGNGITYPNKCELKKAECIAETEIGILYHSECITLPPPPDQLCRAHQRQLSRLNILDYLKMCNQAQLRRKADDGTLTLNDVINCYHPHCTREHTYETLQCSSIDSDWCWCSTPEGVAINSTFQRNLSKETCDKRKSCDYMGRTRRDAEVFNTGCGFCECLDGTVTCYEDLVPDVDGDLNTTQLKLLKEVILQVYFFQYSQDEHVLIDIRHINQHPSEVTKARKDLVLPWKFDYIDRNGDKMLSSPEEFFFQMELYEFVRCKSFFDHVSELMDVNNDANISYNEWTSFFQVCENEGSTSASGQIQIDSST